MRNRFTKFLILITLIFTVPTSSAAPVSTENKSIDEVNKKIADVFLRANMQYPQMNMGIELYLLAAYLSDPFSINEVMTRKNFEAINESMGKKLSEVMLAAHKAHNIQLPEYVLKNPGAPLKPSMEQLTTRVIPVTLMLFLKPDTSGATDGYMRYADIQSEFGSASIQKILDDIFFNKSRSVRLKEGISLVSIQSFGEKLLQILSSKEISSLSKKYRTFLIGEHLKERGEAPAESPGSMLSTSGMQRETFRILCSALCDQRYAGDTITPKGFGLNYKDILSMVWTAAAGSGVRYGPSENWHTDGAIKDLFLGGSCSQLFSP